MDAFFQKLRDIQKKERNTGTLSEIDDTFYDDASKYLQELLNVVNENPLSLEAYQLRDAQRITIEICEKREFKIISTAVANVQKAHDIFKGHKKNSDLYDVIPYNTTPEEEKLYKDIINTIINHREFLMKEVISAPSSSETKVGFKPRPIDKIQGFDSEPTPAQDVETIPEVPNEPEPEPKREPEILDKPAEPKKPSSKPKLDASQIEMMFGHAPDDVLLDENNNPIVSKPKKHDITTPFKPPIVPKEDTVSLQTENKPVKSEEDHKEIDIPKHDTSEQVPQEEIPEVKSQEIIQEPEIQDNADSTVSEMENPEISEEVAESDIPSEVMVVFTKEVTTDVLDENEKTYGPFNIDDVALLPGTIVKILKNNDVISLL